MKLLVCLFLVFALQVSAAEKKIHTCPSDVSCPFFHRLNAFAETISHWPSNCLNLTTSELQDLNNKIAAVHKNVEATCEGACSPPVIAPNGHCTNASSCFHMVNYQQKLVQLKQLANALPVGCIEDRAAQLNTDLNALENLIPSSCQCRVTTIAGCTTTKVCTFFTRYHQAVHNLNQLPLKCLSESTQLSSLIKGLGESVVPICAGACIPPAKLSEFSSCDDIEDCPQYTDLHHRFDQLLDASSDLETACFAKPKSAVADAINNIKAVLAKNCSSCPTDQLPAGCDQADLCTFHNRYNQLFADMEQIGCSGIDTLIPDLQDAKEQVSTACPGSCNLQKFKKSITPCSEATECPALVEILLRVNQTVLALNSLSKSCFVTDLNKTVSGITTVVDAVEYNRCDGFCSSRNTTTSVSTSNDDDDGDILPFGFEVFIAVLIILLLLCVLCVLCVAIAILFVGS